MSAVSLTGHDFMGRLARRTGLDKLSTGTLVECPVHRQLVAAEISGRLVGHCEFCADEADEALLVLGH